MIIFDVLVGVFVERIVVVVWWIVEGFLDEKIVVSDDEWIKVVVIRVCDAVGWIGVVVEGFWIVAIVDVVEKVDESNVVSGKKSCSRRISWNNSWC